MKIEKAIILLIIFLLSVFKCSNDNPVQVKVEVRNIEFSNIETADSDSIRTLKSIKREGELYMITYYGDYNSRLDALNDRIVKYGIGSVIPPSGVNYECSIFAALGDSASPIFGRNLDNYVERGVLVGLYMPPDGYTSIAISNMYHIGFDKGEDPTLLPIDDRRLLLNSVLFADDGINERGVSVALASVDDAQIVRDDNKKLVCISYLMREILDHSGNLEEAINIVKNHDVFDKNVNTISHHILIADASGKSAAVEYCDGEWRIMQNTKPWQIVTNTRLFNMSEDWRRGQCNRYRAADNYLVSVSGKVTWEEGMDILKIMSVGDTQWSTVYDLKNKLVNLSLYRDYKNISSVKLK